MSKLLKDDSKLINQWNYKKNNNSILETVTTGSGKKVWWVCDKGHEWEASILNRSQGRNCPYCSNQKVLKGFNDLETKNPEIAKEWHPTKNGDLKPSNVISGSHKKVWWICDKGHEYESSIGERINRGNSCPYCASQKVLKGFNDLETKNPELAKEWHPTKNGDLKPYNVASNSNKKAWWICDKGHEWETTIATRNNGSGCPYCLNKKLLAGYNDLETKNPEIAKEWHPTKNGNLKPSDVISGSHKKVWWICNNGHEWEANIDRRNDGSGCPYCNKNRTKRGINDLFTIKPFLKKYWDDEKNKLEKIDPYTICISSNIKANWICENCGNKFIRTILKIDKKVLCDECLKNNIVKVKNKNLVEKKGSLLSLFPELAKEWHPTKNGNLKPSDIYFSSTKKAWWICNKGHEWETKINLRTQRKSGCPYCANQKVLKGFNDLETLFPYLVKEWHPTKNGNLKPSDVVARSGKKYWWQCRQGHEWFMSPLDRINGSNCSVCSSERKISVPEKTVLLYIKKNYNGEILSNYRSNEIQNKEIDIYLPKINIGIEYDGLYYHKNIDRDKAKDRIVNELGISLFHIAETINKNLIRDNYIYYKVGNDKNLEWAINVLLNKIFNTNIKYDINISRDRADIYNLIEYYEKEQSILNNYPELAKEWHPTKNGKLKPEFVSYGSDKKVWWICDKGHEWEAVISSRVSGVGCPYCSGNKVIKGENDLLTLFPELAKEWHPTKNGDLKPEDFSIKSNKKVWWLGKCGHEWETSIYSRIIGNNCPFCGSQKLLVGFNDLKTKNPELAKEWHPTKNEKLMPEDVINGSHKKVWWLGKCGHEWQAAIGDRIRNGIGCPYCSNNKLLIGFNDLKTKNPELVKEWHPTKNGDLKPENFFPNSHKKVWWICDKGHEYESYIIDRNNGNGCPICANKLIIKGINDLETLNPNLASYWDNDKNKEKPSEFSIKSGKRVWWACPDCKASWNGRIADVSKKKYICPNCGKKGK